jgi:hypothetical protein
MTISPFFEHLIVVFGKTIDFKIESKFNINTYYQNYIITLLLIAV